jgi:hypothetical protein
VLLLAPGGRSAGNSLVACDGLVTPAACGAGTSSVPAADGVYFNVSTGGGNRDFASVEVICSNGYDTVLTVDVPAKGTGSSQIVYPPAGPCTANQEKQMQIGKARILASITFTVT